MPALPGIFKPCVRLLSLLLSSLHGVSEPEINLKFVRKTFPTEIKFDRKISDLVRDFLL